jgi:hypothetical protein
MPEMSSVPCASGALCRKKEASLAIPTFDRQQSSASTYVQTLPPSCKIAEVVDLQSTVQDEWEGQIYTYTCGWVIWHVMEHDLHHGGEIAYSLAMHGLTAPDI